MSMSKIKGDLRSSLKDTLYELLESNDISNISVTMICEKISISRSTYYKFYTNPLDQIKMMGVDIVDDMRNYVGCHDENPKIFTSLEYVRKNRKKFKLLLAYDMNFHSRLLSYFKNIIFSNLDKNGVKVVGNIYLLHGSFGLIEEWINGNLKMTDLELADLINKLQIKMSN